MRNIIKYNPKLKDLAKKLRNNSTLSEKILWQRLKSKQIKGYDFDRQKPIDNFIVDFYCYELMLAIEIDGITHEGNYDKDLRRHQKLESLGVYILRFNDLDIKQNIDKVLRIIYYWIIAYEKRKK